MATILRGALACKAGEMAGLSSTGMGVGCGAVKSSAVPRGERVLPVWGAAAGTGIVGKEAYRDTRPASPYYPCPGLMAGEADRAPGDGGRP